MNKYIVSIFTTLLITLSESSAELNKSLAQCRSIYGQLTAAEDKNIYSTLQGDLVVTLKFRKGVCCSVSYMVSIRARGLPPTQIEEPQRQKLLRKNAPEQNFIRKPLAGGNLEYKTQDGQFFAFYDATAARFTIADKKHGPR
jgi:hypothetical protein